MSGGIVGSVLLLFGLAESSASETALLLNLESVLTLVMAWVVFKENVDRRLMIGAASIVAGAVVLSWPGNASVGLSWGPLLIAGACLAWAIDNNLTGKISAADGGIRVVREAIHHSWRRTPGGAGCCVS